MTYEHIENIAWYMFTVALQPVLAYGGAVVVLLVFLFTVGLLIGLFLCIMKRSYSVESYGGEHMALLGNTEDKSARRKGEGSPNPEFSSRPSYLEEGSIQELTLTTVSGPRVFFCNSSYVALLIIVFALQLLASICNLLHYVLLNIVALHLWEDSNDDPSSLVSWASFLPLVAVVALAISLIIFFFFVVTAVINLVRWVKQDSGMRDIPDSFGNHRRWNWLSGGFHDLLATRQ